MPSFVMRVVLPFTLVLGVTAGRPMLVEAALEPAGGRVRLIEPRVVTNDDRSPRSAEPGSAYATEPAPAEAAATLTSEEGEFVQLINQLRAGQGLRQLAVHSELVAKARSWSGTMAARGEIWHSSLSDGITVADWYRLGENVGMGPGVGSLHDAFVASPSHYKNLVDPGFEYVGVGIARSTDGTMFVTESFMEMKAPQPVPEPDATEEPTPQANPAPAAPTGGGGGAPSGASPREPAGAAEPASRPIRAPSSRPAPPNVAGATAPPGPDVADPGRGGTPSEAPTLGRVEEISDDGVATTAVVAGVVAVLLTAAGAFAISRRLRRTVP